MTCRRPVRRAGGAGWTSGRPLSIWHRGRSSGCLPRRTWRARGSQAASARPTRSGRPTGSPRRWICSARRSSSARTSRRRSPPTSGWWSSLRDRPYVSISCKPTQLGIHESEAYCLENLRKVVATGRAAGIRVTDRHGGPRLHRRHPPPLQGAARRVRQRRHGAPVSPVPHEGRHPGVARQAVPGADLHRHLQRAEVHRVPGQAGDEREAVRVRATAARQGPLPRDRHARRAAHRPLPRVPRRARVPEGRLRVPDAARRAAPADPVGDRERAAA